ncbi:RES family NAD+ phosphorylase [Rhodophyticola sp. CCM32]|uniref:RES family NAD+ phosphorylase n=1 Tax=Rhodophyticola sp. CCM32 TaxID=2916397 RepID=UPI00143CC346|nr:RES family NAD+ phosphorylase [Rhodophyticola sp. CCM32]
MNAAFCYTRDTGNRFNGPERGAWYAAWGKDRVKTAQAEVSWHLSRELEATGIFENVTSYRELNASFATSFHDLSGTPEDSALNPDISKGYVDGQKLAAQLMGLNANGILYPSVRRCGGRCLAAFRPHLVQNIQQGDTWIFEWSGDPNPSVTRAFCIKPDADASASQPAKH